MFIFELGENLKDKVSGFKGICIARADYLTGCRQYKVRPRGLNKEQLPWVSEWFDEEQLVVLSVKKFSLKPTPTSGPVNNPPTSRGFA
jgi:hypothetical protein